MVSDSEMADLRMRINNNKIHTVTKPYLQEQSSRFDSIKQYGKLLVELEKLTSEVDEKYFKAKQTHYDATNLAVADGRCTKGEAVGYASEVKIFDQEIRDSIKTCKVQHQRQINLNKKDRSQCAYQRGGTPARVQGDGRVQKLRRGNNKVQNRRNNRCRK